MKFAIIFHIYDTRIYIQYTGTQYKLIYSIILYQYYSTRSLVQYSYSILYSSEYSIIQKKKKAVILAGNPAFLSPPFFFFFFRHFGNYPYNRHNIRYITRVFLWVFYLSIIVGGKIPLPTGRELVIQVLASSKEATIGSTIIAFRGQGSGIAVYSYIQIFFGLHACNPLLALCFTAGVKGREVGIFLTSCCSVLYQLSLYLSPGHIILPNKT